MADAPGEQAADDARSLSAGAPGRTRTCDPRLRRPSLYPAELRGPGSGRPDSNRGPQAPKACALPGCATPRDAAECSCHATRVAGEGSPSATAQRPRRPSHDTGAIASAAAMAEIEPLRALHYNLEKTGGLHDVVAPPYDVIDERQRAELEAKSPYNVVGIDLPVGPDPYDDAARQLQE